MTGRALTVGILAPPWLPVPPSSYGGTEAFLDTLARGLRAAGQEVTLFSTGDSTCGVSRGWCFGEALGVSTRGVVHETRQAVEGYEFLSEVDVIHDHTLAGPLYGASRGHPPVVTTAHGPFDQDLNPLYRAISERVSVVAISHHQASTARGWSPAAVVHHGIDVERFEPGAGKGGYVLFLGRMSADKGVDRAAQVARRAGMPLRIAAKMSEPIEREYFDARVKPLLGSDVEYVGEVGFGGKVELLRGATCLLNPIRWHEPFGLVMVEALACGTPVVSTVRGSASEIVEHGVTGYLCESDDALVRGVEDAAGLDRASCRRHAEERFSASRMVEEYLDLYRRANRQVSEAA